VISIIFVDDDPLYLMNCELCFICRISVTKYVLLYLFVILWIWTMYALFRYNFLVFRNRNLWFCWRNVR